MGSAESAAAAEKDALAFPESPGRPFPLENQPGNTRSIRLPRRTARAFSADRPPHSHLPGKQTSSW